MTVIPIRRKPEPYDLSMARLSVSSLREELAMVMDREFTIRRQLAVYEAWISSVEHEDAKLIAAWETIHAI